jgi:hypothetical protein
VSRRAWWPWADDSDAASPAPEPPTPELTAVLEEHNKRWRARALEADAILLDALRKYGRWVPFDVVLDARNAIRPPRPLRPSVPVVPGPDR